MFDQGRGVGEDGPSLLLQRLTPAERRWTVVLEFCDEGSSRGRERKAAQLVPKDRVPLMVTGDDVLRSRRGRLRSFVLSAGVVSVRDLAIGLVLAVGPRWYLAIGFWLELWVGVGGGAGTGLDFPRFPEEQPRPRHSSHSAFGRGEWRAS